MHTLLGHCLLISKTFLSWKCLRGRQDVTHRESKESVLSAGSALIPETVTRSCHPNREAGVLRAHSVPEAWGQAEEHHFCRTVRSVHGAVYLVNIGTEDVLTIVFRSKSMFTAHSSSLPTAWKGSSDLCISPSRDASFMLFATASSPEGGQGLLEGLW